MNSTTSATSSGTTAVLLTPPDSSLAGPSATSGIVDSTGSPLLSGGSGRSGGSSSNGNGGARDRIHRVSGALHSAIDKVEQGLSSKPGGGAGQAGQQAESLMQQISDRPLRSAGIAMGALLILKKLFGRAPRVQIVKVPVPVHVPVYSSWSPSYTRSQMRSLRGTGQSVLGKAGAAAYVGKERAKALGSSLAHNLGSLPQQMRSASRSVQARTQQYGSMARSGVQEHPLAGLAALAGAAALATALWRQRSHGSDDTGYVTMDAGGSGVARQYGWDDGRSGAGSVIAERPVMSALVVIGAAALAGAMLRRHG
jgi:ElaB/YqjD/DUF883 family membrane-anchored ribosome-binding protein